MTESVAQDQIKAFVDRILRLKEEGRAITGDIKEIYAEAKGNGAVAIGRAIQLPPLGRPTTLHYRQHGSTHERGRGVPELGMLSRASIPADGRRACRVGSSSWLSSLHDVVSLKLGAGFGRRPFQRAEGHGANRVLAKPINHPLSASRLKNFAKGSKCHSSAPSLYGTNRRAGDIGLCPTPPRRSQKCLN